jgi:hypothetical protein
MQNMIDLPLREGSALRPDVEHEPIGFEWPSFMYWVKAGMAFTLGAGVVTVLAAAAWFFVWLEFMAGFFRAISR